jgi:MSHA biogenesis protein MshP
MKVPALSRVLRPERGLGAVAAIVVLVVLATIAAAVVRLSTSTATGVSQQLGAARAAQAAQAGIEWGLFQALRNGSCGTSTLDLSADLGMRVTVSCSAASVNEGYVDGSPATPRQFQVFSIEAVACNGPGTCPDAARAVTPHYVERKRMAAATSADP